MEFLSDELKIINAVKYRPAISIVMPFDTATARKPEIEHRLKIAADVVKRQLHNSYPEGKWEHVYRKLQNVLTDLDYDSTKKSIAIFVSPVIANVFYLDVEVEEKITVNDSFEIRDLAYAQQNAVKYLILLITGKQVKLYLGENDELTELAMNIPSNIQAYEKDGAESVSNFTDIKDKKEILQGKFLKSIDNSLSETLKEYNYPILLIGAERITGHFKAISNNVDKIVNAVHGNYEYAPIAHLSKIVKPYVDAIRKRNQDALFEELAKALNENKLDIGANQVWHAANEKLGKLLIVEKNFKYPADYAENETQIHKHDPNANNTLFVTDAVDDIIEMVIRHGGDVKFVEDGMLDDYLHIALIKRY